MKIETRDFGILEIEEKNIITFKQPIFGFEEFTQFVLVNDSNMGNGICWLQSIEQKSVCFIMLNPLEVRRDYAPVVMQDVLIMLQAVPEDDFISISEKRPFQDLGILLYALFFPCWSMNPCIIFVSCAA